MSDFTYVLDLLESKGWHLYEGVAHATFPQVISAGKGRSLRPSVYYHLMPATAHDTSVEEVRAAAAEAARTSTMPTYNDGVNKGRVDGVYISNGEFAFASKPDSFTFSLDSQPVIEDAIKFNLSNYNTLFFKSIDEIGTFLGERGIAPQRPPVLPAQLRWTYAHSENEPSMAVMYPENPGDVLFRGQVRRYLPCVSTAARGLGIDARFMEELSGANQARLIANLIRTEWFVRLLRETTAAKWLKENHIVLDEMAVAQHYGLPTGYIDLTKSFDVAAFFACCRYDWATRAWTAVASARPATYTVSGYMLASGSSSALQVTVVGNTSAGNYHTLPMGRFSTPTRRVRGLPFPTVSRHPRI